MDEQSREEKKAKKLSKSIVKKLNSSDGIVRHMNGNMLDNRASNLQWVTLCDALDHFDEWTTDICADLSPKEARVVADPAWRAGLKWKKGKLKLLSDEEERRIAREKVRTIQEAPTRLYNR